MSYATIDDVTRRYPPIKEMIGTSSLQVSSDDVSSIYIADGEGIVNAYLGSRYSVPLNTEALVTDLTSDIAIYRICEDKLPRIPDYMEKRYLNACSMLAMIRDGYMVLTGSSLSVNTGGDQEVWSNVLDADFHGTVFKPVETWPSCETSFLGGGFNTSSRFG